MVHAGRMVLQRIRESMRSKTDFAFETTLSGRAYATLIKELRILSRAIFVVGPDNKIKYVEYVPEVANYPNFEAALAAVKS